jgi:hypothetical protein
MANLTPKDFARFELLKACLGHEIAGRRAPCPPSAFSIIKEETGIKARSAKELLPLFEDWLEVEVRLAELAAADLRRGDSNI